MTTLQQILSETPAWNKWMDEIAEERTLKAEAKLLTRQLETLHGKLPKWAKEKISTANTRTLEKWAVRLLKADTLEETLR